MKGIWQVISCISLLGEASPMEQQFVDALNERFQSDDEGVFLHMGYWKSDEYWKKKATSLFNKYASTADRLTLYKDGKRPAILMKPEAQRSVRCMAPCDMASDQRVNGGCGTRGFPSQEYRRDKKSMWCGEELWGKTHFPCAMYPNETRRMIHAFRDIRNSLGPLLQPPLGRRGNSPCGYYHVPTNEYNEVVHDGKEWNENVGDDLWAFGLTTTCRDDKSRFEFKTCEQNVLAQMAEFKKAYNREAPLVLIDMENVHSPFSFISGPTEASTCAEIGCGSQFNPQQACQCNEKCLEFGSCCEDYSSKCNVANTCVEIGCGSQFDPQQLCQCNDKCLKFDTCCVDYTGKCNVPNTCADIGCGSKYNPQQACQCNDKCEKYENCCTDKSITCSGENSSFALV